MDTWTYKVLCVIPFCGKDVDRAIDLLVWCRELSGKVHHPALLVADPDVPWPDGVKALDLAREAFAEVDLACLDAHVEGWIPGSVALFTLAAKTAADRKLPWLFMEPDAAPLKKDWLEQLEDAYRRSEKPFMGPLISHQHPGKPSPYLEGVSVYPPNAIDIMGPSLRSDSSWAYSCAPVVVPLAANTPLIHHLWGESKNPPTFAPKNIPGTNIFCLRQIPPEAVIYHRCKDESLIRLLRQSHGLIPQHEHLLVVFPFCEKDAPQFAKTVGWMRELNPHYPNDALLSWEISTSPGAVNLMKNAVASCFANVFQTTYASPRPGEWPPSTAFRHAASYATKFNRPWLWLEYDLIPLKPNWLEALEKEYAAAGKPFMAPLVPGMGHYNGTGIYPVNTPTMLAWAFTQTKMAWDMAAKGEMTGKTHDCGHLLQHVWGVQNGKFHPYLGNAPHFFNGSLLPQVLPTAVAFHRSKDGTLVDRLRERKR